MLKLVKLARGSYTLKYNDTQYIDPTTRKNAIAILKEFNLGCNCGCKDIALLNWCADPYSAEIDGNYDPTVICNKCYENAVWDI